MNNTVENEKTTLFGKYSPEKEEIAKEIEKYEDQIAQMSDVLNKKIYPSKYYKYLTRWRSLKENMGSYFGKNENDKVETTILRGKLTISKIRHSNISSKLHSIYTSRSFLLWQYFNFVKRLFSFGLKHELKYAKIIKGLKILFSMGPLYFLSRIKNHYREHRKLLSINDQYKNWLHSNYPSEKDILRQTELSKSFQLNILLSVIMPVYNSNSEHLLKAIRSVKMQSYKNWELIIVDDHSVKSEILNILKEESLNDSRIHCIYCKSRGGIAKATNAGISSARGNYIAFLDHDDELWPNALFEVAKILQDNPQVKVIYSDEDKLEMNGDHCEPFFKPDWSPRFLQSTNYINHLTCIKKDTIISAGMLKEGFDGAQDWELLLRVTDKCNADEVVHIPTVLYSWRKSAQSTATDVSNASQKIIKSQKKAITTYLNMSSSNASVQKTNHLGLWEVSIARRDTPLVSIIIPTKNQFNHIKTCVDSIFNVTTYPKIEVIVVDGGSTDQNVLEYYVMTQSNHPELRVISWDKPFNFASKCNYGAAKANGEQLIFLNNDTKIITPRWIEKMLQYSEMGNVGAVGCKLLYPNNKIQHAGVVLGMGMKKHEGVAGHLFKNVDDGESTTAKVVYTEAAREISAVTAACLMIEKMKYEKVSGMDESFKIAFNDVDFCLKLLKSGYINIYTGYVKLIHNESSSIGKPGDQHRDMILFQSEVERMIGKWGNELKSDRYYNKNLSLDQEGYNISCD